MNGEARDLRARLTRLALRGAGAALGALVLAVLTAAAASAQTADLAVTQAPLFSPVAAGSTVEFPHDAKERFRLTNAIECPIKGQPNSFVFLLKLVTLDELFLVHGGQPG